MGPRFHIATTDLNDWF